MTSPQHILATIAQHFGVTMAQILGPSKRVELVLARHTAWLELSERCGLGPVAIGRLCNRDHTTVMHGLRKLRRDQGQQPRWWTCQHCGREQPIPRMHHPGQRPLFANGKPVPKPPDWPESPANGRHPGR